MGSAALYAILRKVSEARSEPCIGGCRSSHPPGRGGQGITCNAHSRRSTPRKPRPSAAVHEDSMTKVRCLRRAPVKGMWNDDGKDNAAPHRPLRKAATSARGFAGPGQAVEQRRWGR